jgi:hypothetical protein
MLLNGFPLAVREHMSVGHYRWISQFDDSSTKISSFIGNAAWPSKSPELIAIVLYLCGQKKKYIVTCEYVSCCCYVYNCPLHSLQPRALHTVYQIGRFYPFIGHEGP